VVASDVFLLKATGGFMFQKKRCRGAPG